MEIRGIDVSHWQNNIKFDAVKESGIDFVIIKAGGSDKGFYRDRMFMDNYHKAKAAGLMVGCYYFVGKNFYGEISGLADADRFIEIIKGLQFEYPVFVDIETTDPRHKDRATDATVAFCERMEENGYFTGIYASDISGFKEKLDESRLKPYTHWVARYGNKPQYISDAPLWQYSSKGNIPGISGFCDLDISYVDYAKLITEKGFNGFPKKEKPKKKRKAEVDNDI